jgi:PAS domain S-box-containing protein
VRARRFDGAERIVRARGRVELGEDAAPKRVIGAIQDVTEEALERSARELLSYVVDSSDDAIIITNTRDGTITSWNRGAERLYGYTPEEAIGRPISLVEPPDRAGEQEDILRRVFEGRSVDRFETPRVRKDGTG